jgi:hypothetical protein
MPRKSYLVRNIGKGDTGKSIAGAEHGVRLEREKAIVNGQHDAAHLSGEEHQHAHEAHLHADHACEDEHDGYDVVREEYREVEYIPASMERGMAAVVSDVACMGGSESRVRVHMYTQ